MSALSIDSPEGAAAIFTGASAGDPRGMYLAALLLAGGVQVEQDWPKALTWLERAAARGETNAARDRAVLQADEALDLDRVLWPPPAEPVLQRPKVGVAGALAGPATCAWLIERGGATMQPAQTYLPGEQARTDPGRTNSAASLNSISTGLPLIALRQRIARLLGVRPAQLEATNILRYQPGEQYAEHYDFFGDDAVSAALIQQRGQRAATLLIYLNADYQAGETDFPRLGFSYRGQAGGALFWDNLDPAGRGEPLTLHAGRPPLGRAKWILSQWVRDRDQVR